MAFLLRILDPMPGMVCITYEGCRRLYENKSLIDRSSATDLAIDSILSVPACSRTQIYPVKIGRVCWHRFCLFLSTELQYILRFLPYTYPQRLIDTKSDWEQYLGVRWHLIKFWKIPSKFAK